MRSWWRLVLGAIVGSSIAAAQPAPAPAHTVPLLVIDAPSTFDLTRLANALDTYVPNATLAVTASTGTQPSCDAALAAARAANSTVGLWLHWTADGTVVIERVGEAGCAAIESSTVEAPEQPAFVYRVVALKVASLVRELPAPTPPLAPARPVTTITTTTATTATSAVPARTIDLGASAVASSAAADRVYVASAGAWFGRTWLLGGDLRVGLARDATGPGGDGSVRELGAFVGVRRAIVDRGAWSIDVTAELGVIGVHGSATRTQSAMSAPSAMTDDVWTPALALAPWIRFAVIGPIAMALGPTLELEARPVELDLGVSPLYHAGRVRLRGDVHVELTF